MSVDPLISDDLLELLRAFPSNGLRDLVGILREHRSWSPFRAQRAYEAHGLPDQANFTQYTEDIAAEILWWGGNDLHRQLGREVKWRDVVIWTAAKIGVPKAERSGDRPVLKVEGAILQKAMDDWESLTTEEREANLKKAGWGAGALKGGAVSAAAIAARVGGPELLPFIVARGGAYVLATSVLAPIATVAGILWAAHDLAGPGYRVLRPIVLTIALTRQRLRDERIAAAFGD